MNTFIRFFYEFVSIFFEGLTDIGKGLLQGVIKITNYKQYMDIVNSYKDSFKGPEWLFMTIAIGILVIIFILIALLIFFLLKKIFRFGNKKYKKEDLLDEIANLNSQVRKLSKTNSEIMAMKVSQLGLNPEDENEENKENEKKEGETENEDENEIKNNVVRFPKLCGIDTKMGTGKPKNYNNSFTLEEMLDDFKCYSASQLHLYYDESLLRPFIAGLACGKLIILQGISGTGKTSLAYAWGKFVNNDSCVASVEPSWRDKTEFLGYFNEFTKKFNETESLAEIYLAGYDDNVHTLILDEMNLARVEYYFAEMLSILEMPSRDKWIVELVTSGWPKDPKRLDNGKIQLPGNLWYIGTINNDDSTFMVTDKVYDRAMPIDINTKVNPFPCRDQDAVSINSTYLESLFKDAIDTKKVSLQSIEKVGRMDDYVISHFRVAFGNRIMKQLNTFVPVYVSCGGKEVAGIDYFIAKKIFRKFEQLNLALIRDEIDPFISFLNKEFGDGLMKECIEYLERIKKSI
ncbi:MAG: hypothetical protein RSA91_01125 [Bacilli bacterium]